MKTNRLATALTTIVGQQNWEQQLKDLARINDMRYLDRLAAVNRMPRAISACTHSTIAGQLITRGPALFREYPADYTPNHCFRCCHYDIDNGCRVDESDDTCPYESACNDGCCGNCEMCTDINGCSYFYKYYNA